MGRYRRKFISDDAKIEVYKNGKIETVAQEKAKKMGEKAKKEARVSRHARAKMASQEPKSGSKQAQRDPKNKGKSLIKPVNLNQSEMYTFGEKREGDGQSMEVLKNALHDSLTSAMSRNPNNNTPYSSTGLIISNI